MEHTVNTGRSVYKVDVIDDTVHPHAELPRGEIREWPHPAALSWTGKKGLVFSVHSIACVCFCFRSLWQAHCAHA